MQYIVFYKSTNGKNYFEKVQTSNKANAIKAIKAIKNKYNDVAEIVEVREN